MSEFIIPIEDEKEDAPKPFKITPKSVGGIITPRVKSIKEQLGVYYYDIFEDMYLRLYNQLRSKAREGNMTAKFLGKIDDLKKKLEGSK